uniref:pH-sensitive chloride channel 2 n=1 Tax=Glossina austeni TaxID=7395 RepID=A0A1A9UU80_GLOAU
MRKIVLLVFVLYTSAQASPFDCPSLGDGDSLSQTQLLERLTHSCRYDRLERPITYTEKGSRLPVDVYVRWYIYFMQNLEAHDLQFKIHALLQFRFLDPRLIFRKVSPKRSQPILGEANLRDILWMPHIFLANERDSSIMGTNEKDILTSVSLDGTVIISSRITATLYCWMSLQKFPFDEQHCSTYLESWMYNTSELILHWEQKRPITFNPDVHLTEYVLKQIWSNESTINADLNDLRHGAFAGNYSSLSFTVQLTREVGFYVMDYFLPSMLIVGASWVSFWLQADQAAPRLMLGTSTMLTFITLASAQGKTLPKVSYIKVSEVWFLGCTLFIFGSLLEFAFVNTIWRRTSNVDVKKLKSKYILRSTLSPRLYETTTFRQHSADSVSMTANSVSERPHTAVNCKNYLTKPNMQTDGGVATEETRKFYEFDIGLMEEGGDENVHEKRNSWTTLTPQEISQWIDAKARVMFPIAFIIFNVLFWTFVYTF